MVALDLHISTFFILYGIAISLGYIIWRRRKRNIRFLGVAVVTLYILLLFKVTICPIIFLQGDSRQEFMDTFRNYTLYYQLVPFKTIGNTFQTNAWVLQIFGNIMLLLPVPLLYSLLVKEIPRMKFFMVLGALISLSIELIQFGIDMLGHYPSHVADIDDFILNIIGIVIGILILHIVKNKDFFIRIKSTFLQKKI